MTRSCLLLITTSFPRAGDGSEAAGAFVADLAGEISKLSDLMVVAPGDRSVVEPPSDTHPYTIIRYRAPAGGLSNLSVSRPTDWLQIIRVLINGRRAAAQAAGIARVNHVIAMWALPCGAWARTAARAANCRYSVWALGSDIWQLGKIPGVRSVLGSVLRGAAHRFADGLQLAAQTEKIAGQPVEFLPSTRTLPPSTRTPADAPPYNLIFLGRWHPNKGIDLLLEALSLLPDSTWNRIRAVNIYGGGPMETQVRAAIQTSFNRPVRLHGYVDKEQSIAALTQADYLIIPSRIESIPLVYSDAIKMGCPVITTPVGDLKSLVESTRSGVVADSVSAAALAKSIEIAVASRPSDFNLSQAVQQFDHRAIMQKLLAATDIQTN